MNGLHSLADGVRFRICSGASALSALVMASMSTCLPTPVSASTGGLGNDVIYSIMVDRFYSGNEDNDVPNFAFPGDDEIARDNRYWLSRMHYRSSEGGVAMDGYWGGDLQGVVNKLDYLNYLGVTVIMLSPIFENVNGVHFSAGGTAYHGYWTKDFMRLEEHFVNPPKAGETREQVFSDGVLLKGLIDKAHSYDPPMKVILDIPLNHTSPAPIDTTIFDKTNYLEMGALYEDGRFVSRPCELSGGATCRESATDDGWFHAPDQWVEWNDPSSLYSGYVNGNLADLDQRDPRVRAYFNRAIDKWMALGVDGFRLDAVKNIYPQYIADLERRLVELYPDIILIGEYFDGGIYEDGLSAAGETPSVRWLQGLSHTTMFNFSFARATREFFTGRMDNLGTPYIIQDTIDPLAHRNVLRRRANNLVTFINNHDIPRMLSLDRADPLRYRAALKLMFAAPGVPKLLYGDEIGLGIFADSEHWQQFERSDAIWSRLTMPWEKFDEPLARQLLQLTRSLIGLRREHAFLKDGEVRSLTATNVLQVLDGNSYLALLRHHRDDPKAGQVLYLYSTSDRDRLEFDVDLADGRYTALDGSSTVMVRDGSLLWENVRAHQSLIISGAPPGKADADR